MSNDLNNDMNQHTEDGFAATLYSEEGQHTVKRTDVNIDIDKDNPETKKIIIEKQVNVVNKEAADKKTSENNAPIKCALKNCQLELLDSAYKTAITAIDSIETLNKDYGAELHNEIKRQSEAYRNISKRITDFMAKQGMEPRKVSPLLKAMRWSGIKISSIGKRSDSHIAEMMINGTTMGIIEVYRAMNKCSCDPLTEPRPMANELLELMKSSIYNLVKFL